MKTFIETADSRETSPEIMDAILRTAGNNEATAARVWEAPTETEMVSIWEIVTNNGLRDASEYFWGASGNKWADAAEA